MHSLLKERDEVASLDEIARALVRGNGRGLQEILAFHVGQHELINGSVRLYPREKPHAMNLAGGVACFGVDACNDFIDFHTND